jgi:hypothetical protein
MAVEEIHECLQLNADFDAQAKHAARRRRSSARLCPRIEIDSQLNVGRTPARAFALSRCALGKARQRYAAAPSGVTQTSPHLESHPSQKRQSFSLIFLIYLKICLTCFANDFYI